MKKILLLLSVLLTTSMQMFADGFKAQTLELAPFMGISANGNYGIFSIDGMMLCVVDLNDPDNVSMFFDEEYGYNEYYPGYGTPVALDGTSVGNAVLFDFSDDGLSYTQTDNAVIFKAGGELQILPTPRPKMSNMAHSITPDGSVICGNIGNANFGIDAKDVMVVPAVWYKNAEGGYDDPVLLPRPKTDFLGGIPQYITAIAISADGNTVAGTVTASSGFWCYPIVYKRDVATNEWSYTLPCLNKLFYTHPEVEVPADPGDYPEKKDFLSEEELNTYNDAMANWTYGDWDNYPNIDDYMTAEEKAAYEAACVKFEMDREAYNTAVDAATAGSITMTFNNIVMSPDGKQIASTYTPDTGWGPMMMSKGRKAQQLSPKYSRIMTAMSKKNKAARVEGEDNEEPAETATTYVFNVDDDTYTTYTSADGANVTCAANNGVFIGYAGDVYTPEAVVMVPGKGTIKMQDYYAESCPEMTAWINENMSHEVEVMDYETWETTMENKIISGIPFCTPDMKALVSYAANTFDYENENIPYFGYSFQGLPDVETSGIKTIVKNAGKNAEFFTVDGRKVSAPVKGLNIIKTANGETKKVFLK